ncbi:imidazole glycerol phosphate synthase subunit HisH [Methanomassiliicoccus luminyensis]|uniref:imidazole glycerol phosphate synthase subunit HisH n=1 Tax=Methanomassiliicoccus luminyensis TaxID=1080712 RepID=UPI00037BAD9F|nr:imidazole glycerol phosphate synthase subunit HisH [Methanomassiliicoccus luminyensis]
MVNVRRSVKYPEENDSYRIGQRPKVRVAIADYGVGNLHSIRKALELAGARPVIETNMRSLLDAEVIVFPGVGAFDSCMQKLLPYRDIIVDRLNAGTPCLGICIGAQILFEESEEGASPGLGFMKGKVVKLQAERVPHMGWNRVVSQDSAFEGVESPYFYFAHSYHGGPAENVAVATTDYFGEFPSAFRKKNVLGVQFHPEKSSASGAVFLRNFVKFIEAKL